MPIAACTITIDGPAGTGKSTTARDLAGRLGFDFLDTGAMYRAAALIAVDAGLDTTDGPAVAAAVREADLRFDWNTDPPRLLALRPHPRDLTDRLRTPPIARAVSDVAGCPEVRVVLVEAQRRIRDDHCRLVSGSRGPRPSPRRSAAGGGPAHPGRGRGRDTRGDPPPRSARHDPGRWSPHRAPGRPPPRHDGALPRRGRGYPRTGGPGPPRPVVATAGLRTARHGPP